jgi:hypothetical protein
MAVYSSSRWCSAVWCRDVPYVPYRVFCTVYPVHPFTHTAPPRREKEAAVGAVRPAAPWRLSVATLPLSVAAPLVATSLCGRLSVPTLYTAPDNYRTGQI